MNKQKIKSVICYLSIAINGVLISVIGLEIDSKSKVLDVVQEARSEVVENIILLRRCVGIARVAQATISYQDGIIRAMKACSAEKQDDEQ